MKGIFRTLALVATATLAMTGCYKHYPIDRNDGPDHHQEPAEEKLVVTENSDWSIRYVAREDWVNDDGSVEAVEHFNLSYKGTGYYIIRIIRPEDLKSAYGEQPDLADFFKY